MHPSAIILIVLGVALAFDFVHSSPIIVPAVKAAKSIDVAIQPTDNDKLHELKTAAENHLSSKAKMPKILDKGSKLEGEAAAPAASESAGSADSASSDVDGDDTASKADFWYPHLSVCSFLCSLPILFLQETHDWRRCRRYDGRW